jgi:hypothetical protein
MSFDLLNRPLVFIPVTWAGLGEAGDGAAVEIEHSIDVQIELLDRDEFQAWLERSGEDVENPVERAAHELATFREVAKGWRKIKANGRTPEFNDENVARLLRFPGFVSAFGAAYLKAWRGKVEVREGNSGGSPANGLAGEPTDATRKDATSAAEVPTT